MPTRHNVFRIPAAVQKGVLVTYAPDVLVFSSFTPIPALSSIVCPNTTADEFNVADRNLFDMTFYAEGSDISVQMQQRYDTAAPGDTWRNVGSPWAVVAGTVLEVVGLRVGNRLTRFIASNPGAANCTVTEIVIVNRSQ